METRSLASRSGHFVLIEKPAGNNAWVRQTEKNVLSVVLTINKEEVRTRKLTNKNQQFKPLTPRRWSC